MIETTASLVIACLQATIVGVMAIVTYALFRRFAGPRFGVSVASIGVLCMAIVTLFAFSPWPNWTELSNALTSQTSNRETANVSPKAVSANAKSISKQPPAWDWQTFATEFSRTLHANEQQQNAVRDTTQVSARVPWKSSLLIVVVVSLIYGTTRFVIGLISTHRLRVVEGHQAGHHLDDG